MRCEIVRHGDGLSALAPAWNALFRASAARPVTLHPAWATAWWRCFGGAEGASGAFDGELLTIAAWRGRDLVGLAPFYLAPPHGGPVRSRELRLLGDSLVGAAQVILALPGEEGAVRDRVVEALVGEGRWDLLDVTVASRPRALVTSSPGGDLEALALRFAAMGRAVERFDAHGRAAIDLVTPWERFVAGRPAPFSADPGPGAVSTVTAGEPLEGGLNALARLLSSQSAHASAGGRPGDRALLTFVARVVPALAEVGAARVELLAPSAGGEPVAVAVVIAEGDRRMELVRAADDAHAGEALALASLRRAVDEGAARYEFAADTPLAEGRVPGVRLRVLSSAANPGLSRRYTTFIRRAALVADSAVAQLRAPFDDTLRAVRDSNISRAVARVAEFARMHLYRGELFVWSGGAPPPFARVRLFRGADFAALTVEQRHHFIARLELDAGYCRQKWDRGDLVVVAYHEADPIGILWCARGRVFVPEIGREVKPAPGECYIHDVFVAPDARGHSVAPGMLDFLARELRERDTYRAWALIERTNVASTRAFEKAAYAAFADVIYARMGTTSRLLVRPPDVEAKKFLGLDGP